MSYLVEANPLFALSLNTICPFTFFNSFKIGSSKNYLDCRNTDDY